jgi:hypothetical protein
LSIQKDKRVVKPSKMSERYARWFETRVPSTSPFFRYLLMLLLAIPMSIVSALLYTQLANPLFILGFDLGIGVILYLLYLNILQIRFRSPIADQQFSQIVGSTHDRTVTLRRVHVWPRKSAEPYIVSTFNAVFDAVIISDTMIELVKKMPESGEALLAFHLLRAPRQRNVADLVFAILPFFVATSFFAYILISILIIPYYYLFSLVVYSPFLFLAPVLLAFVVKGSFWVHESAFERASGIYQIHPQVAKDEVMSSQKLDDEASKSTIWVVREWEQKKRNGRRSSITILVLIIEYSLILSILSFNASLSYYMYMSSLYIVIVTVPLVIAFLIYFLLRRWDKRCMGELYYETTQADEPVWID